MNSNLTIPLNEAVERVTHFRNRMLGYMPAPDVPRAVLIPVEALQEIMTRYGNDMNGIRTYFSIEGGPEQTAVTVVVVAVDQQGKDIIAQSKSEGEDDDSDIYNFTGPCPSECDTTSPLFIEP